MTRRKVPLKRLVHFRADPLTDERPLIALEHLDSWTGALTPGAQLGWAGASTQGVAAVEPGDVLFGKLRPYLAKGLVVTAPVAASTELICMRPNAGVEPRWLGYLTRSTTFVEWAVATSEGSKMPRTSWEKLAAFEVDAPDAGEQRAIADYLDAETARIDALIAKKQQLIHLLDERWSAALSAAVAPDGLVSREGRWPTAAFSSVVRIAEGQVDPQDTPWSRMVLVAPNHIQSGTGQLLERETAEEQGAISGKYRCQRGDIIYSKIRPALAKATIAEEDCLCSADMYPMRPGPNLLPRFLLYLLLSPAFTEVAVLESDRVAMPKINRDALGRLRVPLPSLDDQTRIVDGLVREQARIHRVRELLTQQLLSLSEHRQAVITSATAGHGGGSAGSEQRHPLSQPQRAASP